MKGLSKPFNLDTGTAVKVDGRFQEFPTEEEAWEFYKERTSEYGRKRLEA